MSGSGGQRAEEQEEEKQLLTDPLEGLGADPCPPHQLSFRLKASLWPGLGVEEIGGEG